MAPRMAMIQAGPTSDAEKVGIKRLQRIQIEAPACDETDENKGQQQKRNLHQNTLPSGRDPPLPAQPPSQQLLQGPMRTDVTGSKDACQC